MSKLVVKSSYLVAKCRMSRCDESHDTCLWKNPSNPTRYVTVRYEVSRRMRVCMFIRLWEPLCTSHYHYNYITLQLVQVRVIRCNKTFRPILYITDSLAGFVKESDTSFWNKWAIMGACVCVDANAQWWRSWMCYFITGVQTVTTDNYYNRLWDDNFTWNTEWRKLCLPLVIVSKRN